MFELQLFADPETEQPADDPEAPPGEQPTGEDDGDSETEPQIELTIGGKTVLLPAAEVIARAQKDLRFEQEMGQVNKTKAEMEKQRQVFAAEWDNLKDTRQLADFLSKNADAYNYILALYNQQQEGQGTPQNVDGSTAKMIKEIAEWKAAKEAEEQEAQQLEKELKKTSRAVKNLTGQALDVVKFSDELTAYYAEHKDDEEELTPLEVWTELHGTEPKTKASQETVNSLRRARETTRAPIGNAGAGRGEPQHATIRGTLRYNALQAGEKLDDE